MIVIESMKPGCSFVRGLPIVRYVLCDKTEPTEDIDRRLVEFEERFRCCSLFPTNKDKGAAQGSSGCTDFATRPPPQNPDRAVKLWNESEQLS